MDTPDEQLIEAERRTPFQVCDIYCAHAEELLAITGQISAALPSRAAYLARTNPQAAAHPDNRSVKAYTQVGNPACAFIWEIRNNKEGALAKSSDAQYAKALDATDALKDLWEDEPGSTSCRSRRRSSRKSSYSTTTCAQQSSNAQTSWPKSAPALSPHTCEAESGRQEASALQAEHLLPYPLRRGQNR